MPLFEQDVVVPVGAARLPGTLTQAGPGSALVVFAHGSGSGRHSQRNRFVAAELGRAGLGTLLFDLFTEDEERAERFDRHLRFDIELLSARLLGAARWLAGLRATDAPRLGLFGASTGAAAALVAAARAPQWVGAVVSRGGRPDLAGPELERVCAPTLLIVGGADRAVLQMNREALSHLRCERALEVVPFATHLFEEPGALAQVAALASRWFSRHLLAPEAAPEPPAPGSGGP